MVLALTLASLATGTTSSLDRPSWTIGDAWTYDTSTTLIPGLNLTGTVTWNVRGQRSANGSAGPVELYDLVFTGSGSAVGLVSTRYGPVPVHGSWILTGEQLVEPVTLQAVSNLFDLAVNGTAGGFVQYQGRLQNTTTYQIVSTSASYPVVPGNQWSTTVTYSYVQDYSVTGPVNRTNHTTGTGAWIEDFSAGEPIAVATPLGTFQAIPITETWPTGDHDIAFAAAEVGNAVRTESYDPNGSLAAASILTAYRYQALEPPTFLGLTGYQWAVIAAVAAAAGIAGLVLRWRRRKKDPGPPGDPSADLTSGPRGP